MPWSIPFLYSTEFFSSAVFERFAPAFCVVVFDFFLLRPVPDFFFAMVSMLVFCCWCSPFSIALFVTLVFFLVLVVIKINRVNQQQQQAKSERNVQIIRIRPTFLTCSLSIHKLVQTNAADRCNVVVVSIRFDPRQFPHTQASGSELNT